MGAPRDHDGRNAGRTTAAAARQGASILAALAGDWPATRQAQAAGSAPRRPQAVGPAGSDESRHAEATGVRKTSQAGGLPGPAAGATAGARAAVLPAKAVGPGPTAAGDPVAAKAHATQAAGRMMIVSVFIYYAFCNVHGYIARSLAELEGSDWVTQWPKAS